MILDQLSAWVLGNTPLDWLAQGFRLLQLWGPIVSLPGLAASVGLLGSLLALVVLSGVAVLSLGSFLTAALALWLLLSEVFGLRVELARP